MILHQEAATIHVSNFQLLPNSQPVELGLLVELLTRGVAQLAADARDFARY